LPMTTSTALQPLIDAAWEDRARFSPKEHPADLRSAVEDIIDQLDRGVLRSLTYSGSRTIPEFHERAVVGLQSAAGYDEGLPRDTSW